MEYYKQGTHYLAPSQNVVLEYRENETCFVLSLTKSEQNVFNLDYAVPILPSEFIHQVKTALKKAVDILERLQPLQTFEVLDPDGQIHTIQTTDLKSLLLQCKKQEILIKKILNL